MPDWTLRDIPRQTGRLAIVTGGTGGLGLETAAGLAGSGGTVIVAGRDPRKGRDALALLRDRHPDADVRFEPLDLADLGSVAGFAARVTAAGNPIHILVNNAGVMALPGRETTVDGFERQLGTNYLGHFALTAALRPLLTAGEARVVQVSSIAHRNGKIRLDDLQAERAYVPWPAYSQSKLAMLMFALELDRRSRANDWRLGSVAAHPGVARTDLLANGPASGSGPVRRWIGDAAMTIIGHSAAAGALPILMAATQPGLAGGSYLGPQGWKEIKGRPGTARIAPQALDERVGAALWRAAEACTGVSFR